MLNEEQLKQFESHLYNLGNENNLRQSKYPNSKPISIFSSVDRREEEKTSLQKIFDDVLENEEKESQTIPQETAQEVSSDDFATEVPDAEEPVVEDQTPTDDATGDVTTAVPTEEPIVEEQTLADDTTDDTTTAVPDTINEATEESSEEQTEEQATEPIIDDVSFDNTEEIKDDIEEIEQETLSNESGIATDKIELPSQYLSLPEPDSPRDASYTPPTPISSPNVQEIQESHVPDTEKTVDEMIREVSSEILVEDWQDVGDEDRFSQNELEELFSSEEDDSKVGTYHSARDFQQEDEQILFDHLSLYSVFIRESVANILLNDNYEDTSDKLIDLIFEQAPPLVIHRECERMSQLGVRFLLDETIYTQDTLENKLYTLSTQIKKTSKFIFFKLIPSVAIITLVSFYGFFFVIQPFKARVLYERGYSELVEKRYKKSEASFGKAVSIYPMSKYFYQYADEYLKQRQFEKSKDKYTQLILGTNPSVHELMLNKILNYDWFTQISINNTQYAPIDIINFSEKAFNKLMDFELNYNRNFEATHTFASLWITKFPQDTEMQSKQANIYIEQYDFSGEERYLTQAKQLYDSIISMSAGNDKYILQKARWAVRTKNDKFLNDIKTAILSTDMLEVEEDTLTAYIETAEYLLGQKSPFYIADVLDNIERQFPNEPDIPYLFSLYYQQIGQADSQKRELLRSLQRYELQDNIFVLTPNQYQHYIDTYIQLASISLQSDNNLILAQNYIEKAQSLFENAEQIFYLRDKAQFGKVYYIQSQLALLQGNLDEATRLLERTILQGYSPLEVQYFQGLLSYISKDWEKASDYFVSLQAHTEIQKDPSQYSLVLWSSGNALYHKKNYTAAAVQYLTLLEILKKRQIGEHNITTINFERKIDTLAIYTKKSQVENNLGAALYQLSQRSLNKNMTRKEAILTLETSNTRTQNLQRSQDFDLIRSIYQEIPSSNLTAILQSNGQDISIYSDIALSLDNTRYWETPPIQ